MKINKEILENIDTIEILNKHNIEKISQNGSEIKFRCPFHNDNEPSAFINAKTKLFKCFGCGAKGNIITLISKLENLPYYEVVQRLLLNSSETSDYEEKLVKTKEKLELILKVEDTKNNFDIYKKFVDGLPLLSESLEDNYLVNKRKISKEVINRQNIKLFNKSGLIALKNYSVGELLDSGLFKKKDNKISYLGKNHPIVIPFYRDDKIVGLQLRRADDKSNLKYLNIGSISCPYNINAIKESNVIFICEGVIDCLTILSLNKHSIGLIGAMNFKEEWAEYLMGKKIKILLDNDETGKEASKKLKKILLDYEIKSEIIRLKRYKDVNEWFIGEKCNGKMSIR